jgi:predicted nucleic acid-binding protein
MSDKAFVDSNIILYAYSEDEQDKAQIANTVLLDNPHPLIISTQVINEVTSILLRKYKMKAAAVQGVIHELNQVLPVVTFDVGTQLKAIEIKERYMLQYYDALFSQPHLSTAVPFSILKTCSTTKSSIIN